MTAYLWYVVTCRRLPSAEACDSMLGAKMPLHKGAKQQDYVGNESKSKLKSGFFAVLAGEFPFCLLAVFLAVVHFYYQFTIKFRCSNVFRKHI